MDEQEAASFDNELAAFLKKSRHEEEVRRRRLEDFEERVKQRIKRLKKQKDVVTDRTNMSFNQRFQHLRAVFNVGDKVDDYRKESIRQRKTAIAVKLIASDKYKEQFGKALERRIVYYQNRLMDKKKEHIDFLAKEVTKREARWQHSRKKETTWREELAELQRSVDPDADRLRLLLEIQKAHDKFDAYMQSDGLAVEKTIRNRKRKRIEAPLKTDKAPTKKVRVVGGNKKPDEEIYKQAAESIARFTMEWLEGTRGAETVQRGENNFEKEIVGNPDFVHEAQLLKNLWPNAYKGKPWKVFFRAEDEQERDATMEDIYRRQDVVLQAVINMQRVQHVHSLALNTLLQNVSDVRIAVAKDGDMHPQLAKELAAAKHAALLASDPDLKELPFKSITCIADFFVHEDKVTKLAHYLSKYVKYDRKYYARALNTALLHPQLQDIVYWAGPGKRG